LDGRSVRGLWPQRGRGVPAGGRPVHPPGWRSPRTVRRELAASALPAVQDPPGGWPPHHRDDRLSRSGREVVRNVTRAGMASLSEVSTPHPVGDGYRLDVAPEWRHGRGAFGGLVIGALLRAIEQRTADPTRKVRSVTAELPG